MNWLGDILGIAGTAVPPDPAQQANQMQQGQSNPLQQYAQSGLMNTSSTAQQMQMQMQNQYANQAMQYQLAAQGVQNYQQTSMPKHFRLLNEAALTHEAFDTPIDTLCNLWLAKYGDTWVQKADVIDEEFFSLAAQRLLSLGKMEEYYMSDTGRSVLRVLP